MKHALRNQGDFSLRNQGARSIALPRERGEQSQPGNRVPTVMQERHSIHALFYVYRDVLGVRSTDNAPPPMSKHGFQGRGVEGPGISSAVAMLLKPAPGIGAPSIAPCDPSSALSVSVEQVHHPVRLGRLPTFLAEHEQPPP